MCVFLWSESWDSFLTTSETTNRDAGSCWNSSLWLKRDAGLNYYSWINRNKLKYFFKLAIELKPAVPQTSTWGAVPIWWKMVRYMGLAISPSQRSPTEPGIKPGRLPPVGVSSLFLLWQRHTIWRLCICWHCCRMCGHGNGRYPRKCLKSTLKMAELCLWIFI